MADAAPKKPLGSAKPERKGGTMVRLAREGIDGLKEPGIRVSHAFSVGHMSGFGTISSHKAYRISFYQVPGILTVEVVVRGGRGGNERGDILIRFFLGWFKACVGYHRWTS
eukprot:228589-Amorphochlora_amoeboformis.AAC.2